LKSVTQGFSPESWAGRVASDDVMSISIARQFMKIHIKSNFFVPGLKERDSVTMAHSTMSLRQFLEELARMSPTPIEYVHSGAKTLNPDDWEVEVNSVPYQQHPEGLETQLKDGDTVTIKILAFGGG
jgi:hypothetical protein